MVFSLSRAENDAYHLHRYAQGYQAERCCLVGGGASGDLIYFCRDPISKFPSLRPRRKKLKLGGLALTSNIPTADE